MSASASVVFGGPAAAVSSGFSYVAKKIAPKLSVSGATNAVGLPPAAVDSAATREAQAAAANRVRKGAVGTGRGGTILTSPLGLIDEPIGARKVLLGA